MHPVEEKLRGEIGECLVAIGACPTASLIARALNLVIRETDPFFADILHHVSKGRVQTVLSRFHGVRVTVQIPGLVPGLLRLLTDKDGLVDMEYDVGWGKNGLWLDEREQVVMLRVVYMRLLDGLQSHHSRLELLHALSNEEPQPVSEMWEMLDGYPTPALTRNACIAVLDLDRRS